MNRHPGDDDDDGDDSDDEDSRDHKAQKKSRREDDDWKFDSRLLKPPKFLRRQ